MILFFLVVGVFVGMATADHRNTKPFRHRELAHRMKGDVNLFKRQGSGSRFTFYEIGEGACGGFNSEPDFIVALNSAQYGGGYPGPNCFKMITIEYNGKRADARIVDECPSCPYGGLDFSQALFSFFASPDEGVIYGNWWYQDGSGGGGESQQPVTSSEPPPTMTSSPSETTSTWPPLIQVSVGLSSSTTSDTWSTQASSSTRSSSSSSSFSTSLSSEHNVSSQPFSTSTASSSTQTSSSSIGNSSNLVVPTGAIAPDQANLVRTVNQIVLGFGNLMAAGLRLQADSDTRV
ncbi:hypothetical protein VNI00_008253 [Paramarasmius palmivorus]|uniref:Uncharacterized protein n=1 Tax=Paramarasmius palmivorus TaxID=297713 RepID=A0AAW0CZI1_9AGAR